MSENQEDIDTLIFSLSDRQKAAFGALVCERLLPQYRAFCEAANWGSLAVYQEGLVLLYSSAVDEFDIPAATALLEKLAAVSPAFGQYQSLALPYAIDACVALGEALQFLTDKQESHVSNCATAATESVSQFVSDYLGLDPDSRTFAAAMAADPFMLAETARQRRLLEALLQRHEFDGASIQQLRQLNGTGSIIDLARLS